MRSCSQAHARCNQPHGASARVHQHAGRVALKSARQCVRCSSTSKRGEQQTCAAAAVEATTTVAPPAVAYTELPPCRAPKFVHRNTVFTEEFRIRGNEAGPDQRTNIISIANLMQEVGGNHGVALWGRAESGFAAMPDMDHLIFVATRMQIRMLSYPKWGDIVRLETYFAEDGRLASRRDWRIIDVATGELLGAATSTWVTINSQTRRLAKLPDVVRNRFLQLGSDGYVLPQKDTRLKLPDFELPAAYEGPLQVARRSDMDPNGHINNTTYLAWALETLPQEVLDTHHLKEVEMDFKAECHSGDEVECLGMPLTPPAPSSSNGSSSNGSAGGLRKQHQVQFLHSLVKRTPQGGQEVWRARTTWIPQSSHTNGSSSSHSSNGTTFAAYANGSAAANGHANGVANGHANGSNGNGNGNGNGKRAFW